MVVVGTDVHTHNHTFVAVDPVGCELGQLTVKAVSSGHARAVAWAREQFGTELVWAIEDVRNLSARLERDLLAAGQHVVRVPTKMMAAARAAARTRGKSDPIDAAAVARAYLHDPDLPVASHDDVSRQAKLLTDRRDALVVNRTRLTNSLRNRVHEMDPDREPGPRKLTALKHQEHLRQWLSTQPGVLAQIALDELDDIIACTRKIKAYDKQIRDLARQHAPALLDIVGCGDLSAVKLLGESAGALRFKSEAAFARHGGIAPIPVWSGADNNKKVRLSRSGNRQINAAIHRIAITQIRDKNSQGHAYYAKQRAAGKGKADALRRLKRHLCRITFRALTTDHERRQPTPTTALQTAA